MSVIIALLSLAPILLSGYFVLDWLGAERQFAWTERLALAFALGGGLVAQVMFYGSLLAFRYAVVAAMVTAVFLAAAQISRRWHLIGHHWRQIRHALSGRPPIIWLLLVVLFLALVGATSFSTGLGHDGLTFWGLRAKIIFLEGGWPPSSYFPGDWVSHRDYPLLVPFLEAWVYTFLNQVDEQAVKIIFILFYLSLALFFYPAVRRQLSAPLSAIFTGLMMTTPQLATVSALSGYADVPLMAFLFGAGVFIHRWMVRNARSDLLIGATLAALGVWVKREGMVYWLINLVLVAGYITVHRRRWNAATKLKSILTFVTPALLIVLPWVGFLTGQQISNTDFSPVSLAGLLANIDRLPTILNLLWQQWFLAIGSWGLSWTLFWIVSVWQWRRLFSLATMYIWLYALIPHLLMVLSFVFSTWDPYTNHLNLSLVRLCLHPIPVVWYFIATQTEVLDRWLSQMIIWERGGK